MRCLEGSRHTLALAERVDADGLDLSAEFVERAPSEAVEATTELPTGALRAPLLDAVASLSERPGVSMGALVSRVRRALEPGFGVLGVVARPSERAVVRQRVRCRGI